MSKLAALFPEYIRSISPYVPGKPIWQVEAESGVRAVKLASNENPFGPSPLALAAAREAAATVNLYPDTTNLELCRALAAQLGLAPENMIVTCGSTSLLELLTRALLRPGLNAITSERTFALYPTFTRGAGAEYRTVPMRGHRYDLDAIAQAVDENTRLIFIANPNNPTGTLLTAPEIDEFLDQLPEHVIVALDEAYYEFAETFARKREIDYTHAPDYVRSSRNVIVLRTFSKAYGLAALRVGYGFGPAELIGYLSRLKTPFSVTGVSEAAALAAMKDTAHREMTMRNNAEQSEVLLRGLRSLGYHPVESWANFIYCGVGEDAAPLAARLEHEGVIVRPMVGAWGDPQAIRISIGLPEENERLLAALSRVTTACLAR